MDGSRCTTYPISKSLNGLFLYLSEWNGGSFLALASDRPFLIDEHYEMIDVEVVENRKQALDWFDSVIRREDNERSKDTPRLVLDE